MQFKKTYTPLVPRTACSSTNRLTRKKTASTQTDKCLSPFENWFESNRVSKHELNFNEETTKAYSMALEYVNSFHAYMNKKLSEKYCERGDTKPEGNTFFKLPDVPNYATIFFMLLERTAESKLAEKTASAFKKKISCAKSDLEPKKYTTQNSVIEFVPEIKKMSQFKFLEENASLEGIKTSEQEVQTIVSHLRDEDLTSYPTKSISDDISILSSKKSSNVHTALPEDPKLESQIEFMDRKIPSAEKISVDDLLSIMETDKGDEPSDTEHQNVEIPLDQPNELTASNERTHTPTRRDDEQVAMVDIIRKRVQEEITTFLDKNHQFPAKITQSSKLEKSHFHVINIPPQINLLEYAQKKLERQLTSEPRPSSAAGYQEEKPHFLNHHISTRKSMNIRPTTPKKVSNLFRKYSQENFRKTVAESNLANCQYNQSDGDSVILDDEEFEKINGYVADKSLAKQSWTGPANREQSNPLRLSVKDMTRVNEKVLNTIGLFTERGDIRPGVIDILEEQKRAKAKDSRNKQFRSRRQWDLQIHLNPKHDVRSSFTSISSEKSFISLSSTDLRSEFGTKNVSQQVDHHK